MTSSGQPSSPVLPPSPGVGQLVNAEPPDNLRSLIPCAGNSSASRNSAMILSDRPCRLASLPPSKACPEEKPLLEIRPIQDGGGAGIIADGIEPSVGVNGQHERAAVIGPGFDLHEAVINPSRVEVQDGRRRAAPRSPSHVPVQRQVRRESPATKARQRIALPSGRCLLRPIPRQSPSPIRFRSAWKRGCSLIARGNSGPFRNALTCGSRALTASSAQSSASSTLPRTWRSTAMQSRRF